jgi:hypothetical protein
VGFVAVVALKVVVGEGAYAAKTGLGAPVMISGVKQCPAEAGGFRLKSRQPVAPSESSSIKSGETSRALGRLETCRSHRATGPIPPGGIRGPVSRSVFAISSSRAKRSSVCVTIHSEESAGKTGGKS